MLIPQSNAREVYNQIRDLARLEKTAVLILVAGECDSIAASHIFSSFLRSDEIAYSLKPVNNYKEIVTLLQGLDPQSYRSVVLFNCGANVDMEARLGFTDAQWQACKIYIIDSHRPVHFNNIYFDQTPEIDEYGNTTFDTGIKNAKVIVVDNDELGDDLPTFDECCLFDDELPDLDSDDDEEDFSGAHRRRVGGADESTGIEDEDIIAAEKDQRMRKRIATYKIEQYCNLRKDTNESLWWGIIGMTEQYLNSYIGQEQYESTLRALVLEASRLNPEDSKQAANVGRITFVTDFKFNLLRYWTLYDSMYHSEYLATGLQLWHDRKNDSNQLRTLLAKMGIPRTEAEQKYFSMKSSIQEELSSKLAPWVVEFKIPDCQFGTFHKIRHLAHHISAADCVHLATALLNYPSSSTGKWEEEFYKAYDAILWCSSREDLWDEKIVEDASAIQRAIELQKLVVEKAFDQVTSRPTSIANMGTYMGGFRYLRLQVDDSNQLLIQPATLRKIGQLVALISQNQGRNRKSVGYRLVLGVENSSTGECVVVGVETPWTSGIQAPSLLGKLFQMACSTAKGLQLQHESFDGEYIRFSGMNFSNFVSHINQANEALFKHAQYLERHQGADEVDAES